MEITIQFQLISCMKKTRRHTGIDNPSNYTRFGVAVKYLYVHSSGNINARFSVCRFYMQPSDSMELSSCWAATSYSATQEFFSILIAWSFTAMFTKALHWPLNLCHTNLVHITPSYFSKMYANIALTPMAMSSNILPSQSPVCIAFLSNQHYKPSPFHPPWLNHSN